MKPFELMMGDTLERMQEIPDGSVDMILCDLPYGTTACKWDTVIPFEPLWAAYRRVTKKNAAIVLTASQPFTSALVMSNPGMFKHDWVWRKEQGSGFMLAKKRPLMNHESVLVFADGPLTYNPQMETGSSYSRKSKGKFAVKSGVSDCYSVNPQGSDNDNEGLRYPKSVVDFSRSKDRGLHPTQKPVALMEYLIKTYTNPGELVLDNTMGSGTTGVACMNTGRRFIGIERDPAYFAICEDRIGKAFMENYEV